MLKDTFAVTNIANSNLVDDLQYTTQNSIYFPSYRFLKLHWGPTLQIPKSNKLLL